MYGLGLCGYGTEELIDEQKLHSGDADFRSSRFMTSDNRKKPDALVVNYRFLRLTPRVTFFVHVAPRGSEPKARGLGNIWGTSGKNFLKANVLSGESL
ncbi:hypothetical protein AAFF_G00386560 [Aldrovandia affinis]|uniref:Uncharacterized protein n=1 Tax=Aldrovandia affinis TaxID=143900 RepID=A0AAD7SFB6_9TELE|nr:hypothetical protein AAFF_G00386560 [Aldrovandia affinis]